MSEKFKISNLDLYYGDFHALKDINMSIHANEITAFIGPSGCGKSTFLKSLFTEIPYSRVSKTRKTESTSLPTKVCLVSSMVIYFETSNTFSPSLFTSITAEQ